MKNRGKNSCWQLAPDGSIRSKIYPLCKYARIHHVPKDVQRDWLEAARKAIKLARTNMILTENDINELTKAEDRLKRLGL